MIKYKKCMRWFHKKCEVGPFDGKHWMCICCMEREVNEEQLKLPSKEKVRKILGASREQLRKTVQV